MRYYYWAMLENNCYYLAGGLDLPDFQLINYYFLESTSELLEGLLRLLNLGLLMGLGLELVIEGVMALEQEQERVGESKEQLEEMLVGIEKTMDQLEELEVLSWVLSHSSLQGSQSHYSVNFLEAQFLEAQFLEAQVQVVKHKANIQNQHQKPPFQHLRFPLSKQTSFNFGVQNKVLLPSLL